MTRTEQSRCYDAKRYAENPWRRWYATKRWQARRLHQLTSEPLCRICQSLGKVTPAAVADHIIEHHGDPVLFWEGKLQSLCEHCHNSIKQRHERGGVQPVGVDGWPI